MSISQEQYNILNVRLNLIEKDMSLMMAAIEALWISRPPRTVPLESPPAWGIL